MQPLYLHLLHFILFPLPLQSLLLCSKCYQLTVFLLSQWHAIVYFAPGLWMWVASKSKPVTNKKIQTNKTCENKKIMSARSNHAQRWHWYKSDQCAEDSDINYRQTITITTIKKACNTDVNTADKCYTTASGNTTSVVLETWSRVALYDLAAVSDRQTIKKNMEPVSSKEMKI